MVSHGSISISTEQQLTALANTFTHWLIDRTQHQKCFDTRDRWFYRQCINRFVRLGQQLIAATATAIRGNISLNHSRYAHSGLLLLPKSRSTPIHDHAGVTAFSLLLAGSARLDQFSLREQQPADALIRHVGSVTIEPGSGVWIYPLQEPSLHRLTALDSNTVFLDFQFPPTNPTRRSFYFIRNEVASKHYRCNVLSESALATAHKQHLRSHRKCIPQDNLRRHGCCSMAP